MKNASKIYKPYLSKLGMPIIDHHSYFTETYSFDIKYMAPWSQYEDAKKPNEVVSVKELKSKIKVKVNIQPKRMFPD